MSLVEQKRTETCNVQLQMIWCRRNTKHVRVRSSSRPLSTDTQMPGVLCSLLHRWAHARGRHVLGVTKPFSEINFSIINEILV